MQRLVAAFRHHTPGNRAYARAVRVAQRGFRTATVHRRALPDFVIIGGQGCGTTSLYRWLGDHPDVDLSFGKELHFFDLYFDRGERWYRSRFPLHREGRSTGEATPYLFLHPLAPARVAQVLPERSVLIVLLRDPTERAISRYHHACQNGYEHESLPRAIALEAERMARAEPLVRAGEASPEHQFLSYASGGRYAELLRRWYEHVGKERLVVCESEELFASPAARNDLLAALGLAPRDAPMPILNSASAGSPISTASSDVEAAVRHELDATFGAFNEELFSLLGRGLWGR